MNTQKRAPGAGTPKAQEASRPEGCKRSTTHRIPSRRRRCKGHPILQFLGRMLVLLLLLVSLCAVGSCIERLAGPSSLLLAAASLGCAMLIYDWEEDL